MIMLYSFCTHLLFLPSDKNLQLIVEEFHRLNGQKSEIAFIEKHKNSTDPSTLAYVISISMKQAEYSFNPYSKLKTFNTEKKRLEALIQRHPSNIHLRYVRLLIQTNTPKILGYTGAIEGDKAFLKKKLAITDETDFLDQYIRANTNL